MAVFRYDFWLGKRGDFDIELVFGGRFSEKEKWMIKHTARRWMAVVTEDLPDYEFTEGLSGNCTDHSYEISAGTQIDDLRIYVDTYSGDDRPNVGGWGGPHVLREGSHLPVMGCITFNRSLSMGWVLALHEIGHVVGIGTIWDDHGLLQDVNGDTHFNGPRAIAAFDDAGGRNYTGAKVPVQKISGAHWRGDVFIDDELMLPWGGGRLSAITVQALADVGYGVDVAQADPFTLPGAAGKIVAHDVPMRAEGSIFCAAGRRDTPIYVVNPQGRIVRTIDP